MKVAKWGNSLAIRLPAAVVEALNLKDGDDIEIRVADARTLDVARKPGREELLKRLRAFRGRVPPTSSSTGTKRMPGNFFESNLLLYIASGDPAKTDRSERCLTRAE